MAGQSAGFAKGLAGVLSSQRETRVKKESDQAARDFQTRLAMFQVALDQGIESGDFSMSEEMFKILDPEAFKLLEKQGGIGAALGPVLAQQAEEARGSAAIESAPEAQVPVPDAGPLGPRAVPATADAPTLPRTPPIIAEGPGTMLPRAGTSAGGPDFMGHPFGLGYEERQQRVQAEALAAQRAPFDAKIAIARELHREGVYSTLEDAFAAFGIQERFYGRGAQSVKGEMPDGTPAFGVFDPAQGQYLDPATQQPIPGFRPQTTTGSQSLGTYAEQAARDLGYPTAQAAFQAGVFEDVMTRADEIAGSRAGATTSGRGEAAALVPLTTPQRVDKQFEMAAEWKKAEEPLREMQRQHFLMETGLRRFNEGDKIGGSQSVLVTFQKILDPDSVVRESEYARSASGLTIRNRIEGMYERYIGQYDPETQKWVGGGAGVPEPELAMMVATGQAFLDGMVGWNDADRDRITAAAVELGINPDRIFGVADAATGGDLIDDAITLDTPLYFGLDGRATTTRPEAR